MGSGSKSGINFVATSHHVHYTDSHFFPPLCAPIIANSITTHYHWLNSVVPGSSLIIIIIIPNASNTVFILGVSAVFMGL